MAEMFGGFTVGIDNGASVTQKRDGKSFTQEVFTCLLNGVVVTTTEAACKHTPSPSPVPSSIASL